MGRELPLGSRVKVEWGKTTFLGELIYCETYGQEYLIGLKVDDPVYATTRNPSQ
jgi:hypothetical protein